MSSRLKVIQLITRYVPGGAAGVVRDIARRIDRDRFDVEVWAGRDSEDPTGQFSLQGIPFHRVDSLVRSIRPGRDMFALKGLIKQFRKHRPDVVHAHTYKAGVIGSMASRAAGVRAIVFAPHGHIFSTGAKIPGVPAGRVGQAPLMYLTRMASRFAHRIVTVSEVDLEEQVSLKLASREKHVVIRNGIHLEAFRSPNPGERDSLLHDFGLPTDRRPIIGKLARLSGEKGHETLLDAALEIRKQYPDVLFLLAGEGKLRSSIEDGVMARGLERHVRLLGHVDRPEEFLRVLDVCVLSSTYESQGLVLVEAMATRVPVIASEVGGIPDVIRNDETGLMIPPDDPAALSDAIHRTLSETNETARRVDEAWKDATERYCVDRMVREVEALYVGLIGNRGSSTP